VLGINGSRANGAATMAVFEVILESIRLVGPVNVLLLASLSFLILRSIYRIYFHPLSHIPGPILPKITNFWLYYHIYFGDEITCTNRMHAKYGPIVRVSPNEVDISDIDAVQPIYVAKGGFKKTPNYANFDIDGHKTIFSTTDMDYRAPRAKAIVSMFSTKSIRDNQEALYGCVDRMVERLREEAEESKRTGKPVNVLNTGRALAVDGMTTHLFHENYNGTSEKAQRLVSNFPSTQLFNFS